ncbi:unnamed protein product [Nippostrongylus brasiliensis]|uniref:Col_cuticle_N domain-containing protein n=1 Tax=Nippostrongylus brasiliensis TaxID=27835 RepID=A0A0N4YMN0_NIPBR|nr:unnamed protein product [Nippostrongylus brasiliensis]
MRKDFVKFFTALTLFPLIVRAALLLLHTAVILAMEYPPVKIIHALHRVERMLQTIGCFSFAIGSIIYFANSLHTWRLKRLPKGWVSSSLPYVIVVLVLTMLVVLDRFPPILNKFNYANLSPLVFLAILSASAAVVIALLIAAIIVGIFCSDVKPSVTTYDPAVVNAASRILWVVPVMIIAGLACLVDLMGSLSEDPYLSTISVSISPPILLMSVFLFLPPYRDMRVVCVDVLLFASLVMSTIAFTSLIINVFYIIWLSNDIQDFFNKELNEATRFVENSWDELQALQKDSDFSLHSWRAVRRAPPNKIPINGITGDISAELHTRSGEQMTGAYSIYSFAVDYPLENVETPFSPSPADYDTSSEYRAQAPTAIGAGKPSYTDIVRSVYLNPKCKFTGSIPFQRGDPGLPGYPGRDGEPAPDWSHLRTSSESSCPPCVPGPPGPPGQKGELGRTGPHGIRGAPGAPGLHGEPGPPGPPGEEGLRGDIGPKGAKGASGAPGFLASKGARGPRGPLGATGVPGPRGISGPPGDRGPRGKRGPVGPPGQPVGEYTGRNHNFWTARRILELA